MGDAPALFTDGELAPVPDKLLTIAVEHWNAAAQAHGWPKALILTTARRTALRRAVKDYGGLAGWKAALERAGRSSFLTGRSGRGGSHANWRPDLEFFLRPAQIVKLQEGGWDDAQRAAEPSNGGPVAIDWRGRLFKYRKGGFWPPTWGSRPEERGPHLAGAEHIAEWRKANRIAEPEALSESVEQRLESSIASLRRHGHYDRANSAEEKLAKLQGRPPVLVPHPEVAAVGMPEKAPRHHPVPRMTDVIAEPMPAPPAWVDEAVPEPEMVAE